MPRPAPNTNPVATPNTAVSPTIAHARNRTSPAPMRMPSSTKAIALTGCIAATHHSTKAVSRRTSASSVNTAGSSGRTARTSAPSTAPPTTPSSSTRRAAARARAPSPAPRRRPTIAWAAIASASSARARAFQSWNAIWWAARSAVPMRVATAVATVNAARSVAVRTSRSRAHHRQSPDGPEVGPERDVEAARPRATARTYTKPAPVCARTVASADAPMPKPRPGMRRSSRARLTAFAASATTSGVRVSWRPRR